MPLLADSVLVNMYIADRVLPLIRDYPFIPTITVPVMAVVEDDEVRRQALLVKIPVRLEDMNGAVIIFADAGEPPAVVEAPPREGDEIVRDDQI